MLFYVVLNKKQTVMKKVIFILLTLLSILITSCSQTNESKAKKVIKEYFKETLDDYDSYSPMNYSELNMTETKWKLPKELEPELIKLTEVVKRINQQFGYTIEITSDVDYYIEKIDANHFIEEINKYTGEKYKKHTTEEFRSKLEKEKPLWLEFKHYQDKINASKNNFQPEFIGWKMTHKFRAKNRMGGNELNEIEFQFDKDITKVVKARKVK